MTQKTRIETEMDEILEYLGVDRPTLQKLIHAGVERLLEPPVDNRINAFLRSDPPNLEKGM